MSNIVLQHHGILGMKWGRRRYQNPDGSLTPEGKARYGTNSEGEVKSRGGIRVGLQRFGGEGKAKTVFKKAFDQNIKAGKDKAPISAAEKVSKETRAGLDEASKLAGGISRMQRSRVSKNMISPKSMTDEQLKSSIERLRMEKAYQELASADVDVGANHVKDIIDTIGAGVGVATSIISIIAAINNAKGGK